MKRICATILLSAFFAIASAQSFSIPLLECETDSIVWKVSNVMEEGEETCTHRWEYSEEYHPYQGKACAEYHGLGCHCEWTNRYRKRICNVCHRHEQQEEVWYQHTVEKPKTRYQELVDSLFTQPELDLDYDTVYQSGIIKLDSNSLSRVFSFSDTSFTLDYLSVTEAVKDTSEVEILYWGKKLKSFKGIKIETFSQSGSFRFPSSFVPAVYYRKGRKKPLDNARIVAVYKRK